MSEFVSERISEHIYRLCDPLQTAMYLVIGSKEAVLIDTGCGFAGLKEMVEALTELPVSVILTHGHFDHASGAGLFERVYMHSVDKELYQKHCTQACRKLFLGEAAAALPMPSMKAEMLPLTDRQVFDLGEVHVEMVHVPGHTGGMMMALIQEDEAMIFGDACGVSVLLVEDESTSVSKYRAALRRVRAEYAGKYRRVLRNHGTFESSCAILDEVIACCDDILQGCDDREVVEVPGFEGLYRCRRIDPKTGMRVDGKEGNLVYRLDKAC